MQEDNRVALMALHYLPAIGWFTNLMKYPTFSLEKCEHFVKSSGRNRCELATAQGKQTLSIPILGGRSQQTVVADILLADDRPWQRQHWHAIQTAYGKAPYFEDYAPYFEPYYAKKYSSLWDFNFDLLQCCFQLLAWQPAFNITERYEKYPPATTHDFRGLKSIQLLDQPSYYQGFTTQTGFLSNLSILDLFFHLGPESLSYLRRC